MMRYKSEALAVIHETAEALHAQGVIGKTTLRNFNASCLAPVEFMTLEKIRAIREREKLSQPVFVRHPNVSRNFISD
jgi:putative transcriptional regulator